MVQISNRVKPPSFFLLKKGLRRIVLVFMLLSLGLLLGGCGKKPGFVEAPENTPANSFHKTYPDPETDPAP